MTEQWHGQLVDLDETKDSLTGIRVTLPATIQLMKPMLLLGALLLASPATSPDDDGVAAGRKAGTSPVKLYNLREDIGKTKDLAAAQPDKVKELQAKWDEWNKANVKPLWGGGRAGKATTADQGRRAMSARTQIIPPTQHRRSAPSC